MHSTWLDNDHQRNTGINRIESASKKQLPNRIQVISKINLPNDRSQTQMNFYQPQQSQYMNHTCVQRFDKPHMKRMNTTDGANNEKDERDRNLMKLMQEQLEFAKAAYEQKIKEQLKQSSIEISKLKIKLQNNTELIQSKDQLIEQLKIELGKTSPTKQQQQHQYVLSANNLTNKINDVQIKCGALIQNQNKLSKKIADIGVKVQCVQKGLLSILACKMYNIQMKMNEYIQKTSQKLMNIESGLINNIKKQVSTNFLDIKSQQIPPNIQSLFQLVESIKEEVTLFKKKEFRYENSNVMNLKKEISHLKNVIFDLEKKMQSAQTILNQSRCSSRRGCDSAKKPNSSNSWDFDDYKQVQQDMDSLGDDQFFYPLEESTKKFLQKQFSQPTYHQQRPTIHNDSYENFTSQDQQEDTPNVKRLLKTLKSGSFKLPLAIEVDLSGCIRKKQDQKYLVDSEKKGFMLSNLELNQCREKGLIIW